MNPDEDLVSLRNRIEKLEKLLQEKEMAFDAVLEKTIAGYWDWNITDQTEYLSAAFKAMFGYDDDELKNTPEAREKIMHPDDLHLFQEKYKEHADSKGEIPFECELRYFHKNGSIIWTWCKGVVIEWTADGSPKRMVGSHLDITKFRSLNTLFEQVQTAANMGVWKFNVQSQKAYWSDEVYKIHEVEKGTGISSSDLINYYHDDSKELIEQVVEEAIDYQRSWDIEAKLVTKKGKEKWVRVIGFPVESNGKVTELRGLYADINLATKYKIELEKTFEQAKSEKSRAEQFAYAASHDLQEPLRTISSMLELIDEDLKGKLDHKTQLKFDFVQKASARMKNLVNDLLDFSRIGSFGELDKVDLNNLIHEVTSDLSDLIKRNNANLRVDKLPVLGGYPEDLRMLFTNMITNAIKFRFPYRDPIVHIYAEETFDGHVIHFKDNGIGIEQKYDDKIFKIFQRLHNRHEYEGTGVGLAHCKKIVELHEGSISFDSEPGEGTIFHITLKSLN